MPTQSPEQLFSKLDHFHGSERIIQHRLTYALVFTEGIDYLRREAGAFWLVDAIASYYTRGVSTIRRASPRFQDLHFWTLKKQESGAILEAREDSSMPAVISQEIEYTDFPFPESGELKLYCGRTETQHGTAWCLMLPSEY